MRRRDPDELTDREREVLELLRRDFTNEQVAQRLGISLDGAKYHVSQILSKLGVASREEAAAVVLVGERRRWWAGWPLWARIAGAATVATAVVGLAVLAWGASRTDESDELITEERTSPQATANATTPDPTFAPQPMAVAPFGPDVIGSYDDIHDFRSFAARIDAAVQGDDVQFFLDNTRFEDFRCDQGGFPARPRACGEGFNDAVVSAVVIGIMQSEGYGADRLEYENFVRGVLSSSAQSRDPYGIGRARLYSYGVRRPSSGGPSPGDDMLDAVVTAISAQGPSGIIFESPRRMLLVFHTTFDGEQWVIDWLSYGGDPFSVPLYLDPAGAGTEVETGGPIWQFWQRWEPNPPTP